MGKEDARAFFFPTPAAEGRFQSAKLRFQEEPGCGQGPGGRGVRTWVRQSGEEYIPGRWHRRRRGRAAAELTESFLQPLLPLLPPPSSPPRAASRPPPLPLCRPHPTFKEIADSKQTNCSLRTPESGSPKFVRLHSGYKNTATGFRARWG